MKTEEDKALNEPVKRKKRNKAIAIIGVAALATAVIGLGFSAIVMKRNHDQYKQQTAMEKEQMIKKFDNSYQQIEKNLFEITAHEDILRSNFTEEGDLESPLSQEERVQREMQIIQSLIAENDRLINELEAKLGEKDQAVMDVEKRNRRLKRKLTAFQQQVSELEIANAALTDSLTAKEIQNQQLAANLEVTRVENDSLNANLVRQSESYLQQETALKTQLNTTYYVVGPYKELAELDVVEKEGGVLGIGSTKELKEDFDPAQFTPINKKDFTMIPVFAKKAELATTHPSNSYKWIEGEAGIQWLEIKQPEEFWEQSKYLVVLTDKRLELAVNDL